MARVTHFADILKIWFIFIERIFKDSKKVKSVRIYVLKRNLCPYFVLYTFLGSSLAKV